MGFYGLKLYDCSDQWKNYIQTLIADYSLCLFKIRNFKFTWKNFNKTVGKFEYTLWSASVAHSRESRHLWMWNYVKGTDDDRGSYWFTSWHNIRSLGLLLLQRNISVELCTQNLVKYFVFSPIASCRKGSGRTPGRPSRGTVNHWPDIFLATNSRKT